MKKFLLMLSAFKSAFEAIAHTDLCRSGTVCLVDPTSACEPGIRISNQIGLRTIKLNYILAILLMAILFSANTQAQSTFEFTYDASGNRLTRAVIYLKSATIPVDSVQAKLAEQPTDDLVGLQKTRIYPNPTKGLLRIDLPSLTEQNAIIKVHDSSGRLIHQLSAVELNNELNLSSYPSGIYIMSIQIGQNDRKEWKIIKE